MSIALLSTRGCAMVDALVAVGELPLAAVDTRSMELPAYACPYGLPAIDGGETLVIVSSWLKSLRGQGYDVSHHVLPLLRRRFDRIVAIDHADPFLLDFTDEVIEQVEVVMKVHGVFKDPELYNYAVGAITPRGRWIEKLERLGKDYRPENLRKVRLAIPCFVSVAPLVRQRTRPFYGRSRVHCAAYAAADLALGRLSRPISTRRPPRLTVHFYGTLTHGQRAIAARMLRKSSLPWVGGITQVPDCVQGYGDRIGITEFSPAERQEVENALRKDGVMVNGLNRIAYQASMWDAKVVLSIAGFGELCFRQAEAWANRRVLVCQDMSHVETLYPLKPGRNVVYCRPDLSDLVEILEDIECNFSRYAPIAEQGYRDWLEWSANVREVIRTGYAPLFGNN